MSWSDGDEWPSDPFGEGGPGDEGWDEDVAQRWPLTWRGLLPRERWLWFERLWSDVCTLRERYRLAVRSEWWDDEVQVEALAALAAWVERYDTGEWDDPPGKLVAPVRPRAGRGRAARRASTRSTPTAIGWRSCAISSTSAASRPPGSDSMSGDERRRDTVRCAASSTEAGTSRPRARLPLRGIPGGQTRPRPVHREPMRCIQGGTSRHARPEQSGSAPPRPVTHRRSSAGCTASSSAARSPTRSRARSWMVGVGGPTISQSAGPACSSRDPSGSSSCRSPPSR